MSKFDIEWTTFPVCPHCGEEDQDWWDGLSADMGDGDSWDVDCVFCDNPYIVTMSVSVHFDTQLPNKPIDLTRDAPRSMQD